MRVYSLNARTLVLVIAALMFAKAAFSECPPDALWGPALRYLRKPTSLFMLEDRALVKFLEPYEKYPNRIAKLSQDLEVCSALMSPEDQACLAPYLSVTKKYKAGVIPGTSQYSSGMDIADKEYQEKYLKGYMDRVPPQIKDPNLYKLFGKDKPNAKEEVVKLLRKNPGWIVTLYRDLNFGDTIVAYVPGDKDHDMVFQFRLQVDGGLQFPNSITVLKSENGKPLDRPKLIYEALDVVPPNTAANPEPLLVMTSIPDPRDKHRRNPGGTPGSCFQCHMGGFMHLKPDEKASGVNKKAAAQINEKLQSYGLTEQVGVSRDIDPKTGLTGRLQLPIGPVNPPSRDDDFIKRCSKSPLSEASRAKVKAAMNCASCHNGERIKVDGKQATSKQLEDLAKSETFELKPIFTDGSDGYGGLFPRFATLAVERVLMHDKTMPAGWELSEKEREALLGCLIRENEEMVREKLEPKGCRFFTAPHTTPILDPFVNPSRGVSSGSVDDKGTSKIIPSATGIPTPSEPPKEKEKTKKSIQDN